MANRKDDRRKTFLEMAQGLGERKMRKEPNIALTGMEANMEKRMP